MEHVVCFGCGNLGKYFAETYGKYLTIDFFLDNHVEMDSKFCGYDRFVPSAEMCRNVFIVITNLRYYQEIAKQLNGYGLTENYDFISISEFEKKNPTIRKDLRTVRCWFTDFWEGFDVYNNFFVKILRINYNVILDSETPEFLFCSVFYAEKEPEMLRYPCVRIFYTGENLIPNFNIYDYAIGFDYINYGDRYLRWPLYWIYEEDVDRALSKHIVYDMDRFMDRAFGCRVVSSEKSKFREYLFAEISKKKWIASGGRCKNNLPNGRNVKNKRDFLEKYKFNLAMENADAPGYVTEKIVQAWAAGCIPLYWGGGRMIGEEFNKEAFIDCSDFASVDELVEYLTDLEQDRKKLEKILAAPAFLKEKSQALNDMAAFLKNIVEKPVEKRLRRLSLVSDYAKKQETLYLTGGQY